MSRHTVCQQVCRQGDRREDSFEGHWLGSTWWTAVLERKVKTGAKGAWSWSLLCFSFCWTSNISQSCSLVCAGWPTSAQCRVTNPWSVQGDQPPGQCRVTGSDLPVSSLLAFSICSLRLTKKTLMQLYEKALCLAVTSFGSTWLWNSKHEIC